MTFFRIGDSGFAFSDGDLIQVSIIIIVAGLVLGVCAWVAVGVQRTKDNSKPLQRREAKIVEKPTKTPTVEWCVVEFENGERMKLRNFHVDTVIIAVGDVGIIDYRGITIQAFHPISENRM